MNLTQRLSLVQEISDSFWKKTTRNCFPYKVAHCRNVQEGDIVLIDNDAVRGDGK